MLIRKSHVATERFATRAFAAVCIAVIVGFTMWTASAQAAEDDDAAASSNDGTISVEHLSASEAAAISDAKPSDGAEEQSDQVEPTSEVVTSYYHDAWYEALESEGSAPADGEEPASGEGNEGEGSASDAESEAEDEKPADHELDPKLNDLGTDNLINFQQTPDGSFLYDTSIIDLATPGQNSQNGSLVQVKGEVVGDAIRAEQNPGKYWITLDSLEQDRIDGKGEASISVLVDESVLDIIDTYGGYNKTGTILRVKGMFFLACTSHEGIMDIHAETVSVISTGVVTEDEFDIRSFIPGFVLCGIGLLFLAVYRFLAERQR